MLKKQIAHTCATLGGSIAAVISMYCFLPTAFERSTLKASFWEKELQIMMSVIMFLHGIAVGVVVWFGLIFFFAWCMMNKDEYGTFYDSFFKNDQD